jgi:uncharacterized protein YlxW (UPF0749 family)
MTLALENCLISDIPNIFSPEKVYDLPDEKVVMLAAESKQIQRERERLQSELEKLQIGLAACRQHQPRESIGELTRSLFSSSSLAGESNRYASYVA